MTKTLEEMFKALQQLFNIRPGFKTEELQKPSFEVMKLCDYCNVIVQQPFFCSPYEEYYTDSFTIYCIECGRINRILFLDGKIPVNNIPETSIHSSSNAVISYIEFSLKFKYKMKTFKFL